MEFLKQIAERAKETERARIYEGIDATIEQSFEAFVQLIVEAEQGIDRDLAEAAAICMVKDKEDQVKNKKEGKKKKTSIKEAMDAEWQADVALLESLSADTIEKLYDAVTLMIEQCTQVALTDTKLVGETEVDRQFVAEAACVDSMAKIANKKKDALKAKKKADKAEEKQVIS